MDEIFFNKNGYLIFDTNISESLISNIINSVDYTNVKHRRVQDGWKQNEFIKALALHPNIINKIKELYHQTPLPFQTLNFKVGTTQPIHSDTIHFQTEPQNNMCGVWVALEDINEDNGPLFYYPESHKEPCLTYKDFDLPYEPKESYPKYEKLLQQKINNTQYQKTYGIMKKGQAIIWAANLLHGGSKIKNHKSTRHSQVTHYFFKSEYYYTPLSYDGENIYKRNPEWIV